MTRQTVHGTFDQEYRFSATQNNGKTTQSKDWIANQEVTYTYDALGRLTAARTTDPSQWGLSWAYDGFDIRLSQAVTQGSAPVSNLLVDAATNRISTSGFGYDANGNLTLQPSNITMAYDVENRLTSYNGQISYGYAPDNKRVWTSGPPEVVYFYGTNGEATGTYQVVVNAGVLSLTTRDTSLDFAGVALQRQSKTVLVDRLSSVRQWGSTGSNYFPYGEEQVTTAQGRAKFGLDYFGG